MTEELLVEMERRLSEAEARLAIMDLEAEYARAWDAADGKAWAQVFTENGVFEMAPVGDQEGQVVRGAAHLEAFCLEISARYRGLHFMHIPRLRLSGERAVARVHFQWTGIFRRSDSHSGHRLAEGYYDVTYVKVSDRWLIDHRFEKAIGGQINDSFDVYTTPDIGPY